MLHRFNSAQWKSIKPAVLIGLALALLQIGSGLAAYYQSKNLLWEGKFQTSHNLTQPYTTVHNFYKTLQNFRKLYKTYDKNILKTKLHKTLQNYTTPYTIVQNLSFSKLYKNNITQLSQTNQKSLHNFTTLYNIVQKQ